MKKSLRYLYLYVSNVGQFHSKQSFTDSDFFMLTDCIHIAFQKIKGIGSKKTIFG